MINRKYLRTKLFRVVIIVAVCGLLIFLNPYKIFSPVQNILSVAGYPFEKTFYFFSLKIRGVKEIFFSIGKLKDENTRLTEENNVLHFQLVEIEDLRKENNDLRRQLELLPRENYELQATSIIGQSATGSNSWILIDQGRDQGIEKGMAVIVSRGNLTGRVAEVFSRSAKVNLITNPESIINAETSGGSRGVIRGEYGLGVVIDMVISTDQLNPEDRIFTSGVGGDLPRGFFIGTVKESFTSSDGLFKRATVIPAVDFSKTRFVFVVKKIRTQNPT